MESETKCICYNCDNSFDEDDGRISDCSGHGEFYCESCYEDLFTNCCCCECEMRRDEVYCSDITDENYCEECYYDNFFRCSNCDCECRVGDTCECQENTYDVHDFEYKPMPIFYSLATERKSNLFFGVECEIEAPDDSGDDFLQNIDEDILYAKHDGSINNGFEVVSHPMTFDYIKDNNVWSEMFALSKVGCVSYKTSTCGMHVHLSSKAFGTWQLYKFLKFFQDNQDFILLISQRKPELLSQWASLTNDESIAYKIKYKGNTSRYVAVNLRNEETVEIRIFRGTLYRKSFYKNIEFCKALFDFSKNEKPEDMKQTNFIQFVTEHQKQFRNLYNFLKGKDLCA